LKITVKYLLTVLFLSISVLCISFGRQKAEWKGKIDIEDGVKVIKNPGEPLYGNIILELEEDLRIGNEEDENYSFYRGVSLAVDKDENIYVLDRGNHRIQIFNKNGYYLQSIGREGQGPGEFQNPSKIFIDSKGDIYVNETHRISIFNNKGTFRNSIPLDTNIYYWGITKEGHILAQTHTIIPEKRTRTMDVSLFNSRGNKIKTIASYPFPLGRMVKGVFIGTFNTFSPRVRLVSVNNNYVIYGHSSKYKLFMVNAEGKTVLIIEKSEKPKMITPKEKNDVLENEIALIKRHRNIKLSKNDIEKIYPFPAHQPFYMGIKSDDKGNIYILKYPEEKGVFCYDLFDINGYYLYEIKMKPLILEVIKNSNIYTYEREKETGYIRVLRYKIKNWEQIKERI
jgi:hypothetical protein